MSHPFETLPTTPTAEEVLDQAFSRAARSGRAKDGIEAQRSMLQTATNVASDNLENVVTSWPDFDMLDPFYRELADATVASHTVAADDAVGVGGVDALRQHLSEVQWASRKAKDIHSEYQGRMTTDADTARKLRKQAFARLDDVVSEVADDLAALSEARNEIGRASCRERVCLYV